MTTYTTHGDAVNEAREILERIRDSHFPDVRDHGVTFQILLAHPATDKNGDPTGPALKRHGVPCHAMIAVTPYKYRCMDVPDCQLYLDADWWECLTARQREALIHHELQHISFKVDKDGGLKTDDRERPLFGMGPHHHEFGWFDSTVREFGEASNEFSQWQAFDEHRRQQWLFADLEPEEDEPEEDDDHATLAMDRRQAAKITRKMAGATR
jgi:hypothetical protein